MVSSRLASKVGKERGGRQARSEEPPGPPSATATAQATGSISPKIGSPLLLYSIFCLEVSTCCEKMKIEPR